MGESSYRDFAHRLRVTRIILAVSEKEAAARAGVSLATYRKWESEGRLSTEPALRFAEAFDISVEWLFAGETAFIGRHLSRARGKVVLLPAGGPWWRQHHSRRFGAPPPAA